jgi:hypothetical protein
MKSLERMPEKRQSLLESTKREVFDALDERIWDTQLQGREPSVEQKLEFSHALREVIFDNLMGLEKIRKRQNQVKTGDFETLKFMIEQGHLNERGRGDVNIFLQTEDVLRDEALSQIAFLRETDQNISDFEKMAGYTEEEIESRASVRRQHTSTYEAEWGVS